MSLRTFAHGLEGAGFWIGHMALVIRTVYILPIPARRERDGRPDATSARLGGETLRVVSGARRAAGNSGHAGVVGGHVTAMAKLALHALGRLQRGVAHEHAEPFLESGDVGLAIVRGDVIHGDAAVGAETDVRELRHPSVRAVARAEVHHRRPVVREVLGERAARAGRLRHEVVRVRAHRGLEGVPAYDLVHVGGHYDARVHEGVEALDRELRAAEADHLLGWRALRQERQGYGCPVHLGQYRADSLFSCGFDLFVLLWSCRLNERNKPQEDEGYGSVLYWAVGCYLYIYICVGVPEQEAAADDWVSMYISLKLDIKLY